MEKSENIKENDDSLLEFHKNSISNINKGISSFCILLPLTEKSSIFRYLL